MSWTALGRPDPGAWIPALHEPPLISLGNGAGWGRGGEYWSSWLGPSPRSPPSSPSCPLCVALESPVWQVEGPRLVYNPWQTTCPESHGQLPAKPGKIQDVRGPRRKRFLSLASESERRGGGSGSRGQGEGCRRQLFIRRPSRFPIAIGHFRSSSHLSERLALPRAAGELTAARRPLCGN